MNAPYRHPREEVLERFAMNQATEAELEDVETHILICHSCVQYLEFLDSQIAVTKRALEQLVRERDLESRETRSSWWRRLVTIPKLSLASAGALAALAMVFLSIPRDVTVTAFRGTETQIVPEGRPLRVHLNALDLAVGPVNVELVDSKGSSVWKGASHVRHDAVEVNLPRITSTGVYFLRLLSAKPEPGDEGLLREFALTARWTLE